eukprot:scaffold253373_cov35-Tisochrysis_lutea.AAC.4
MIQFATEAAITVLRIDDMIKLAPEEQGQPGMMPEATRGENIKAFSQKKLPNILGYAPTRSRFPCYHYY